MAFICLPATAQTMMAGLDDNFASPQDPALPSSELARVLDLRGGTQDFDQTAGLNGGSTNTSVAHTFVEIPVNIVSATLELTIRASTARGTVTDGIFLSFVESATTDFADAVVWGRSFGPVVNPPASSPFTETDRIGLLGGWTVGQQAKIILDLAAVPLASGGTLNLIPGLNSHGFLDVTVGDETAVDYMKLTIVTSETVPGPPPRFVLHDALFVPATSDSPARARGNITGGPPFGEIHLEYSTDLANSDSWEFLKLLSLDSDGRAAFGFPTPLVLPDTAGAKSCFLRAVILEP